MRLEPMGMALRAGLLRRERFVSFDEIHSLDERGLTLSDGQRMRLPQQPLDAVRGVLAGPVMSGNLRDDAAAWLRYLTGSWSALTAARVLLQMAQAAGASDVHLEPGPDGCAVRFRRRGELEAFAVLPNEPAGRLTAALKRLAGCLPYRRDLPQEGRIPREGVAGDVRASFVPAAFGDRVALRLFGQLLELDALGFPAGVLDALRSALARPSGLLLVAGPSGAGKTTTLYAALFQLSRTRRGAHLSLEDPIEQRLRSAGVGVDQVELCPERGFTAESALRAALRQDVDVLCVGEVRSNAEAELALKAAHTGRLVLAGLHAGSAREARQRMLDLGADPRLLQASLVGVLHQRLEPSACECGGSCRRCEGSGRALKVVASWEGE